MNLRVIPCTQSRAKQFIAKHHRHHTPKVGAIFTVAVADTDNVVRGVASVGWPVARHYSDGFTIEVNRVATDGCKNACSALLGACRRIAFAMGYRRIITYTLHEEGGASLRGAGWIMDSDNAGGRSDLWHSREGRSVEMSERHAIKCRWVSYNRKALTDSVVWPEQATKDRQVSLLQGAPIVLDGGEL